jgi:dTDP-4-amino-4,6-dideoxygalactose transaminase
MGLRFGGKLGDCPVSEDVSDRLLRLPFYNTLSAQDQALVIETVRSFKPAAQRSAPAAGIPRG